MGKTVSETGNMEVDAQCFKDATADGLGMRIVKTAKSLVKLLVATHKVSYARSEHDRPLVILGNGPSLKSTLSGHIDYIKNHADAMAVNFAANTREFKQIRPKYYILADPHFFNNPTDPNVSLLLDNIRGVDWDMTLFLPFAARNDCPLQDNEYLRIEYYNAVGIEGFDWLKNVAWRSRRGMPRPRNILIPAIMTGIGMGYREIYITGADHTWTATVSVDENNHVHTNQAHFYKEDEKEAKRIASEYVRYPLHSILYSFYLAFKAYHEIARFARLENVEIYNATPCSMIDAFPRHGLPS